jgi:hypothetical protein
MLDMDLIMTIMTFFLKATAAPGLQERFLTVI